MLSRSKYNIYLKGSDFLYHPISDYGIIGDLYTVALINRTGSIEWLCLPFLDSPSVFGALLDNEKGGCFSISPEGSYDSTSNYIEDTNILVTSFRSSTGKAELTDFMPVSNQGEELFEEHNSVIFRIIEVTRGNMSFIINFDPAFDYARSLSRISRKENTITASNGNTQLHLMATVPLEAERERSVSTINIDQGEKVYFALAYEKKEDLVCSGERVESYLEKTLQYWKKWLSRAETGRNIDLGYFRESVNRSALTLKLLYYDPTGAIAAAATTSLPEEVGGIRNWDYRYSWVRDTAFTLQALFKLGHLSETEGYLRWIEGLIPECAAGNIRIMYGLRGDEVPFESFLDHLEGYKGSRPVRTGNEAALQTQLDVYGEIMDAALKLSDYAGKIDISMWPFLRNICNHVTRNWMERDMGIWEVRGGPYHFVYSKVMCWVALDRGSRIARRYGFPGETEYWEQTASKIKEEVLDKGWNSVEGYFCQHYETDAIDASALMIPISGFLPFSDIRVRSTVKKIREKLEREGLVYRYRNEDGLSGEEGVFLLCSFWLIDCLIGMGELEEAQLLLCRIQGLANHLGLFSEEYDPEWHEQLGNYPQAFTHIGYINSVISLLEKKAGQSKEVPEKNKRYSTSLLFSSKIILNKIEPDTIQDLKNKTDPSTELKLTMNTLRGAFFDTEKGRIAYEKMKGSELYSQYQEVSRKLQFMDLDILQRREEKIAFWINLYNAMVIHAVIELGIRDSVKEVRGFFNKVLYRIGGEDFSLNDIEHGILRGNRKAPASLIRQFRGNDTRKRHIIIPSEPEIHFALVCASTSCPPIEVYSPEKIYEELNIAAGTFINSGGILFDRKIPSVTLSRIFRWYGGDFAENERDMISYISRYLYDKNERDLILKYINTLKISYSDYDWRLNRYEK